MTTTPSPRLALLLTVCLLATGAARAGTLQLRVTAQDGTPARDVVVWVATPVRVPPPTFPPAAVVIEQRDLQFVPPVTVVRTGTPVRFSNQDRYDHHVRSVPSGPLGSVPPANAFELRLSGNDPKARSAEILADKPGIVGLGCHLHSSMRGSLFVTDSPYFTKTDQNGVAQLDNLPDGPADVRLWHADQLVEQVAQKVTVGPTPLSATAQLNFSPRRRR